MIKVLFLAANPSDTTRLNLYEESRAIDAALREADFRDKFELEAHFAVHADELTRLLLRHKPHIVHFSGHGSESDAIIFQNQSGQSHPVSGETLRQLFQVLKDNLRCVILNACYSEAQAEVMAQEVDCVIGMSSLINDEAAISFAAAFYTGLGYGRDIKTAFNLARVQLNLENLPGYDIPQLLTVKGKPEDIKFEEENNNEGTRKKEIEDKTERRENDKVRENTLSPISQKTSNIDAEVRARDNKDNVSRLNPERRKAILVFVGAILAALIVLSPQLYDRINALFATASTTTAVSQSPTNTSSPEIATQTNTATSATRTPASPTPTSLLMIQLPTNTVPTSLNDSSTLALSPKEALIKYFTFIKEALNSTGNDKEYKYNIAFKMLSNNFVKDNISNDKALQHLKSDFEKYQWGWENNLGEPTLVPPDPVAEYTNAGEASVTLNLYLARANSSYKIRYLLRQDEHMGIQQFNYWLIVDSQFVSK